jgi:hypothetical protein
VTISALLSNLGENRPGVASRAGHFFVHAAKRILSGVMIKFGNSANGGPADARMAIFAGNIERTVRTSARLPLGIRRAAEREGKDQEHEPTTDLGNARNGCLPVL